MLKKAIGAFTGLTPIWRVVSLVITVLLLLWAATFVYGLLFSASNTKIKLGENTTEAAIESGKDGVETVGAQGAAEGEIDSDVKGSQDAIDKAETGADIDAAIRDGLR